MGTSKPLTLAIPWEWKDELWVKELEAKGHVVVRFPPNWEWHQMDLILLPNCARFLPGMEQFLDTFIKGARAIRYGKVNK